MALSPIHIEGTRFVDAEGRHVILRGVNLGGDCKVPYPDGGTNFPSDFADHREVSFIGRPFPLEEADEHFGRLRHWGFNCLRMLTTWEAVEHAGPGQYDTAYLDYYAELCRLAGDYGFYLFVDFHQDVWARMSGGDGAPGWTFDAVGLDFNAFHEAGAAKVMQYCYDYARGGGRQEDNYPTMSWSQNYRRPANAIMWTLFFAGRDFAPQMTIDGRNVQDFLQGCYLGSMAEIAKRVKHMPHVLGFDTLNEPGHGWIGHEMSYRHVKRDEAHDEMVLPGPAWSPLDGLLVARGIPRTVPMVDFSVKEMAMAVVGEERANDMRVPIWKDGALCPFEEAGAYRLYANGEADVLDEDFFSKRNGRPVDLETDYMAPFYNRVAETIRAENGDWLVFAEVDPFKAALGQTIASDAPPRTVNANHWYDAVTLRTKTYNYPTTFNPFNGKMIEGDEAIEAAYVSQLSQAASSGRNLNGGEGAPTLIGECGIPYDLDQAAAYKAWAAGDRSSAPWEKHVIALDLMYNAMDRLLLSTTQWNYTASNSNDQNTGDGWNQEDLSIFSRDQQADASNPDSGGRAIEGFCRPYVRKAQGVLIAQRFDRKAKRFTAEIDVKPEAGATDIYVPHIHYPDGFSVETSGGEAVKDGQGVTVTGAPAGPLTVTVTPA